MQELEQYDLFECPFKSFNHWFSKAKAVEQNASAFALATSSLEGKPSNRYLLLKSCEDERFLFFTNYLSNKAKELDENPFAEMAFYWHCSGRQLRVKGSIEKAPFEVGKNYFSSRDYESQVASAASRQSHTIEDKEHFLIQVEKIKKMHPSEVPCPENWGGYYLHATEFEFFLYGEYRLNDRFHYDYLGKDKWQINRLQP